MTVLNREESVPLRYQETRIIHNPDTDETLSIKFMNADEVEEEMNLSRMGMSDRCAVVYERKTGVE